jgi:hypothetical protein
MLPAPLGKDDFTVEFSLYQEAWYSGADPYSNILIVNSSYVPYLSTFPSFTSGDSGQAVAIAAGGSVYVDSGSVLNQWESYAASRVAGTIYLFRDGVLLTSFPDTNDYSDSGFSVSHQVNGSYNPTMGSIGQIRVTHAGRYTSSYQTCPAGFATSG